MKDLLRDSLEEQILQDAMDGDTTVLNELLNMLPAYIIHGSLSDARQEAFKDIEFHSSPYMISTSDGHDIDYTYYDSERDAYETFEYMKSYESDVRLYELTPYNEYEVIKSYVS